jgi:hypothetical protein
MRKDFFPDREADMLSWARNFAARAQADPEGCDLDPETVAQFVGLVDAFADAYAVAAAPATRTKPATAAKRAARRAMERMARSLAARAKHSASVSTVQKFQLGLSVVPAGRGPTIPRPSAAPLVRVRGVVGRRVSLLVRDADRPHSLARPRGVGCALLFLHVGERAPSSPDEWKFAGMTTVTKATVRLPEGLPAGMQFWVCARWGNPTQQLGPASLPLGGYAPFTGALPAAAAA